MTKREINAEGSREVESLPDTHDQAGSFIAGNAAENHTELLVLATDLSVDSGTAILSNPLAGSFPRTINQYRIISLLGRGGMGEVWLAEDGRLKRKVALKLLPVEFTNDTDRLRRFEQEALAISALNHPNIITIHEIGDSEAGRFIVMELVAGQTLRTFATEMIAFDSLIAWGSQLARALHVAHSAGITHRDIKPDNVMVREDGYVKVLDFGLARLDASRDNLGDTESLDITKSGILLGTVKYMSPEQARGERVTSASDIFALGIMFYELATGTHPFNSTTLLGTLQQITTETPVPPAQLNPDLPAVFDALIQRMLAKDADRRPSATAVEAALRELERWRDNETRESGAVPFSLSPSLYTDAVPSIAVLPFVNMSADAENEYFCDGLAEELLNALSKIEALHVAARTSSFSFKGKETDIREIGRKLNVSAVLEGSVRRAGNRLRITVQLINIANGYHLWSERYDRQMEDIFDIQDEISLSIVDALKVKLLGVEKAAVTERYTGNPEAYELFLKGRFHYSKWNEDGWKTALTYFEQALALEPEYVPALALRGLTYGTLLYWGHLPASEWAAQVMTMVTEAWRLNPGLAESCYSLAMGQFYIAWDWDAAVETFQRALAANPNHSDARSQFAMLLAILGRKEEALAEANRARELDPLSFLTNLAIGWVFWMTGESESMAAQCRELMELEPNRTGAYHLTAVERWLQGDYATAIASYRKAISLGSGQVHLAELACLYGLTGERAEVEKIISQFEQTQQQKAVSPYRLTLAYAGLGEVERALEFLEQAFAIRDGGALFFKYLAPVIPEFNKHPRLADLLRRIGLPE